MKSIISKIKQALPYFFHVSWGILKSLVRPKEFCIRWGDPYTIKKGLLTYNQDGLATVHNSDFLKEPLFQEAYRLGKETGSWNWGKEEIQWRVHVACWAATVAKNLEGDFIECGVNLGGMPRAIIHYIDFNETNKKFYLLDTFSGMPEKLISEEEKKHCIHHYVNKYGNTLDQVKNIFKDFNVKIIPGMVPDTLPLVDTQKISFLSLDMNCTEPEIAAAEYFWEKLVTGAMVLLDDYGWKFHITQKKAFDDFAKKRKVAILSLPTGQGIIIKP